MKSAIDRDELNQALRRCGSSWSAEQAHGLLCSSLSVGGAEGGVIWLRRVLEGADPASVHARECAVLLESLLNETHQQLSERQSGFSLLLPGDDDPAAARATALAAWCEGFLHGLVTDVHNEELKKRLAKEPLSDIIRDLLEMTRATADEDDEGTEEAYTELVEYLRVAVQLTYEELADFRAAQDEKASPDVDDPVLH